MVTQAYTISAVKNAAPPRVKMSQYDHDSRTIVFTVVNGSGSVMDLTGKTVSVEGTRADGHAFTVSCTVNGNNVSFAETADMTNQAGDHSAELVVRENGQRLGTMNFIVSVEPAAMDENASITPEDQSLFTQLYGSVDDAVAEVDTAKDAALQEIAQGLASGSPLVANTVAEMTDTDEVYLYTGSESGYTAGSWYYYNGTAWVVGGVYGAGTTDATLTLTGVAADAKATGDRIETVTGNKKYNDWLSGRINTSGTSVSFVPSSSGTWTCIVVDCAEGDIFTVSASATSSSYRAWCFCKSTGEIVSRPGTNITLTEEVIVTPAGATKLIVNTLVSYDYSLYKGMLVKTKLKEITRNTEHLDMLDGSVYQECKNVGITNTVNKYWNTEGSVAVLTDISAQFYASDPIPVSAGDTFLLTAQQGTTNKTRIWVVTDDNLTIIKMCENLNNSAFTSEHTVMFTVPENGTKLLLTKQATSSSQRLVKLESALNFLLKPLKGKRMSLLGDSVSAYAGTVPTGYDVYYTGSNSGVTSANQMWWKILCDKTGMIPLIINGYSGSGVTQLEDSSHVSKVPMSSDERCSGLDDGTHTPDVIIIAGGLNDYTYALSAQSEPLAWNGKTAPVISASFTEAYACMIKKLQTNYPNAIIVCLSTWFTMRGSDNGYTLTHTVGNNVYTQTDYNDAIKAVCEQMHVPFIDVSNVGFNRNNFYPTYAEDSSSIPTHPNAEGHYVIGCAVAEKICTLVGGYFMR